MGNKAAKIYRVLPKNENVEDLLSALTTLIPTFTTSDSFVAILEKRKNENKHSKAFSVFMHFQCPKFCFVREDDQAGSCSVDFGVYLKNNVKIFTIEAKLLPIPKDPKRKEFEYVFGEGGGMERFRNEKHGLTDQEELLPENGIIAYVKSGTFENWLNNINTWICKPNAGWPESEKLMKESIGETFGRYTSTHTRTGGSELILHHFWVKV